MSEPFQVGDRVLPWGEARFARIIEIGEPPDPGMASPAALIVYDERPDHKTWWHMGYLTKVAAH